MKIQLLSLAGALLCCTALTATSAFAQDSRDATVDEITVFGRATDTTFTIPQTVEVLGADLIEQTMSETVGDVLRFVPGAQRDGSPLDSFGDTVLIRGFEANQTLNGLYANNIQQARDSIGVERVEVLKGPASVLYGQMQPGAAVNIVTKQPKREFAGEASATYGSFDDTRLTLDLTGPLTAGGAVRYRLTGAYDDAGSFVDFWRRKHVYIAPVLAFDLGETTTVTVEGFYSRNHLDGFYNGVPAAGGVLPNPNGRFDRSLSLTDPTLPPSTRENTNVSVRLDHQFSDNLRWRTVLDWTNESRDEANVLGVFGWDVGKQTLSRILLKGGGKGDIWTFHSNLAFDVATGGFDHALAVGGDYTKLNRSTPRQVFFLDSLDLFNPVYATTAAPPMTEYVAARRSITEKSSATGLFAQDRITLNDRLKVVAGARWTDFKESATTFLPAAASTSTDSQSHSAWTTQLGLLYSPIDDVLVFVNRTTSFLPAYGTRLDGSTLDPETGEQYEIGVKAKVADGKATLGASIFHLTRGDLVVADRVNPGFQISIGEQVARGVELTIDYRPVEGTHLHAGYAYTDAETTKDTDPTLVGLPIRNVPKQSLVLYGDHSWAAGALSGLTLSGSATYTGKRSGEVNNTFQLPSYWRLDASISYTLTGSIDVGASVENIADETFYDYAYSEFEVWPGAPRTWKVFVRSRF